MGIMFLKYSSIHNQQDTDQHQFQPKLIDGEMMGCIIVSKQRYANYEFAHITVALLIKHGFNGVKKYVGTTKKHVIPIIEFN